MLGYAGIKATGKGVSGAALTNTLTATSILAADMRWDMQSRYFEPGSLQCAGKGTKFRWVLGGIMSTLVTAPGTLLFTVKIGAVVAYSGGNTPLNIVAKVNVPWEVELQIEVTEIGIAATLGGIGWFTSEAYINTAVLATGPAPGRAPMPSTGYVNPGTVFDDTAAATWDVFCTWSVASASNSIQCKYGTLEQLN